MSKNVPPGKISETKNALFLLSRVPTHLSLTSNSRCLYELKLKACLSKRVCEIFQIRSLFVFIK